MGWNYFFLPLSVVISKLLQPYSTANADVKIIAHSPLADGVIWTVNEITARNAAPLWHLEAGQTRRVICCNLIEKRKGIWGFKRVEENSQLCQYSCPVHYFDLAPQTSPEWRQKVRQYHQSLRASQVFQHHEHAALA